jgi:hypothetical protein
LAEILQNPRVHTGQGYQQKCSRLALVEHDGIVQTEHGTGILVDTEEELRNFLLSNDEEIAELMKKINDIMKCLKVFDVHRGKLVAKMDKKFQHFEQQSTEAQPQAEAKTKAHALRVIAEKTCERCNRVFSSDHACQQHWNAIHEFSCDMCERDFNSYHALNQHKTAKSHWKKCNSEK